MRRNAPQQGVRESNPRSRAIVYVRNNHDQAALPFVFVSGHSDPAANTAADLSRRSSSFHHRYRRSRWYERTHRVLVRRSREIEQRIEVFAGGDGAFTLPDVGPGEYDVLVERVLSGTYTRSIRYGGRDVLSDAVRIGIDPNDSLDVSLSPMTGTVEGHVSERVDVPSPGVQVVLVPELRLRRRPDRYIVGLTDVSGNFQLTGVPPGQYTAFAFEQIEPEAYYAFANDPSVSARFADRAASVNLNQGNVTRLELKAIPSAETAGGFR